MKHIASKMIRALCGIAAMLVLVTGIAFMPVYALDNGIYLAAAAPHYQHPVTGMIEDSGGEKSKVLGQSMTESALHNEALVEVDPQGNTYITVRLNLMDNIEHPAFSVDTARNGSFTEVSSSVMQEDFSENTTDFRMQVKDENVILRCAMYVVPMGRDVVFYITVSDLKAGNGSFIPSVEVASPVTEPSAAEISQTPAQSAAPDPSQAAEPPRTSAAPAPATVSRVQSSAPESSVSSETSKKSKPEKTSQLSKNSEVSQKSGPTESSTASKAEETTSAVSESSGQSSQAESSEILQSSDSTETAGLTEFDAQGSEVKETSSNTRSADGSDTAIWVIIGIAAVAAIGIIVWIILRKRKGAK